MKMRLLQIGVIIAFSLGVFIFGDALDSKFRHLSGLLEAVKNEERQVSRSLGPMFLGLTDNYVNPLPEVGKVKEKLAGLDDVNAVIELSRIVQGSRPIYATGKWVDFDELMSSPMGDCNLISLRFIKYSSQLGYKGIRRWELNDYLPGHVFVDLTKGEKRFLVDLDHGVVVQVQEQGSYVVNYLPMKMNYYLPDNVFTDHWGSVEALKMWFVEVRENRWPKYLKDKGIKHIDSLPTDTWPKKKI